MSQDIDIPPFFLDAIYERAQRTHDVLIVTSVTMWATLFGLRRSRPGAYLMV